MTDTLSRPGTGTPAPGPDAPAAYDPAMIDPDEQRLALLRIVVFVLLGLAVAAWRGALPTVLVVAALLSMIMLHELGHYLTARWGGMKVTEFFVGFGPRLWSIRKGETEYGIKALPIGGYVKIIGMHNLDRVEDPADEPRTYRQKPFPQRLAVAVAGSTMHVLIAFVLFVVINTLVGVPAASLRIGEISRIEGDRSPAEEAGFRVGDRVLAVDGNRVDEWEDIPPYIQARPEQDITFLVQRDGAEIELTARPVDLSQVRVDGRVVTTERRGFVGIGADVDLVTQGPLRGTVMAASQLVGGDFLEDDTQVAPGLLDNAKALASVFSPSGVASYWKTLTGAPQPEREDGGTRFLSPVGFVRVAGQAADTGVASVLVLLIAINLFVGLFNLLPLLPLDGGHVAIAVYELVRERFQRGQRYFTDVAKLLPVAYVVVMLMVFLGVSALYMDIVRPLNIR